MGACGPVHGSWVLQRGGMWMRWRSYMALQGRKCMIYLLNSPHCDFIHFCDQANHRQICFANSGHYRARGGGRLRVFISPHIPLRRV